MEDEGWLMLERLQKMFDDPTVSKRIYLRLERDAGVRAALRSKLVPS